MQPEDQIDINSIPVANPEQNVCNFAQIPNLWNCDNCDLIILGQMYFHMKEGVNENDEKQVKDVKNYYEYCEECILHNFNKNTCESHPLIFKELEKLNFELTPAQVQVLIDKKINDQKRNMHIVKQKFKGKLLKLAEPIRQDVFLRSMLKILSDRFPYHIKGLDVAKFSHKLSLWENSADFLEQIVFDLVKRKNLIELNRSTINIDQFDIWRYNHVQFLVFLRNWIYEIIEPFIQQDVLMSENWVEHTYKELGISFQLPPNWKPFFSVTSERFEENISISTSLGPTVSLPVIHATQLAKYSFNNLREHASIFLQNRLNVRAPNIRVVSEEIFQIESSFPQKSHDGVLLELLCNNEEESTSIRSHAYSAVCVANNRMYILNYIEQLTPPPIPIKYHTTTRIPSSVIKRIFNSFKLFEARQPEHELSLCSPWSSVVLPLPNSFSSFRLANQTKGITSLSREGKVLMSAFSFKEYVNSAVLPLLMVQVKQSETPFVLNTEQCEFVCTEPLILNHLKSCENASISFFNTVKVATVTLNPNVPKQMYRLAIATFEISGQHYMVTMQGAHDFPSMSSFDKIAKHCISNISMHHPSYYEKQQFKETLLSLSKLYCLFFVIVVLCLIDSCFRYDNKEHGMRIYFDSESTYTATSTAQCSEISEGYFRPFLWFSVAGLVLIRMSSQLYIKPVVDLEETVIKIRAEMEETCKSIGDKLTLHFMNKIIVHSLAQEIPAIELAYSVKQAGEQGTVKHFLLWLFIQPKDALKPDNARIYTVSGTSSKPFKSVDDFMSLTRRCLNGACVICKFNKVFSLLTVNSTKCHVPTLFQ